MADGPRASATTGSGWLRHYRSPLALVGAGVVALIMVLWGSSELFTPFPPRASSGCDPADQTVIKTMGRSEVTVNIYNAGAAPGTAGRFATRFAALGFKVGTVTNAPAGTQIPVAAVVGPSSTDPATMLVAAAIGKTAIVTTDPTLLLEPGVNVFLGPKHRPLVKHPPQSVPLATPQVICD